MYKRQANDIVNGTSATTFAPNSPITREQMAAILYRYAAYKGYDVSQKADLSGYTDAASISGYAKDALAWANAQKRCVSETGICKGVLPQRFLQASCSDWVSETWTCIPSFFSWAYAAIHCHRGTLEVYSPWMEASTKIWPFPAPCHSSVSRRWLSQSLQVAGLKSAGAPK